MNIFSTGRKYRTCPVGIHGFSGNNPELAPFDFYLQTKLQVPTRDINIHREPAQELEQHKYQMKCELRHDICFTEVQTRLSPTLR